MHGPISIIADRCIFLQQTRENHVFKVVKPLIIEISVEIQFLMGKEVFIKTICIYISVSDIEPLINSL